MIFFGGGGAPDGWDFGSSDSLSHVAESGLNANNSSLTLSPRVTPQGEYKTRLSVIEHDAKVLTSVQMGSLTDKYFPVMAAIQILSSSALPDGEPLDKKTAQIGQRVLSWFAWMSYPAPRVFSHGGDAVVFRWDKDGARLYMTVTDEDAAIRTIPAGENEGIVQYLDISDEGKLIEAHKLLSRDSQQTVSTTP